MRCAEKAEGRGSQAWSNLGATTLVSVIFGGLVPPTWSGRRGSNPRPQAWEAPTTAVTEIQTSVVAHPNATRQAASLCWACPECTLANTLGAAGEQRRASGSENGDHR
jgi:hypothetical protein